jgi:hypothetical protein
LGCKADGAAASWITVEALINHSGATSDSLPHTQVATMPIVRRETESVRMRLIHLDGPEAISRVSLKEVLQSRLCSSLQNRFESSYRVVRLYRGIIQLAEDVYYP